jgi:hypothetical protein
MFELFLNVAFAKPNASFACLAKHFTFIESNNDPSGKFIKYRSSPLVARHCASVSDRISPLKIEITSSLYIGITVNKPLPEPGI